LSIAPLNAHDRALRAYCFFFSLVVMRYHSCSADIQVTFNFHKVLIIIRPANLHRWWKHFLILCNPKCLTVIRKKVRHYILMWVTRIQTTIPYLISQKCILILFSELYLRRPFENFVDWWQCASVMLLCLPLHNSGVLPPVYELFKRPS
jgi:hypothetical protein